MEDVVRTRIPREWTKRMSMNKELPMELDDSRFELGKQSQKIFSGQSAETMAWT